MNAPSEGRTFDSLAAASAALKISRAELSAAKAMGCSAFRSGRVHEKPLADFRRGLRWKPGERSWAFVFGEAEFFETTAEQRRCFFGSADAF